MSIAKLRNKQIAEEASAWAVKLDAGPLAIGDKKALVLWLSQSALHVDELLLSAAIMTGLSAVDAQKKISIDDLLKEAAPEIVTLFPNKPHAPSKKGQSYKYLVQSRKYMTAIAAVIMISVLTGLYLFLANPYAQGQIAFVTNTGEQRSITLKDGSVVHANTETKIDIKYSETERTVKLLRGEAMFEVAHDAARPFRVYSRATIAQAVGTTFNVRQVDGVIKVAVLEGIVAVRSGHKPGNINTAPDMPGYKKYLLKAGEQASVTENGDIIANANPNIKAVASWRIRKLIFMSDTLATIAAEFNRYNYEQIYVDDKTIAALKFSGVFNADDPHSFIKYLESSNKINIDRPRPSEFRLNAHVYTNN